MSTIGEYFIEELKKVSENLGMYNSEEEYMETPKEFQEISRTKDLPKTGKVFIGDSLDEEVEYLHFKIEHTVVGGELGYEIVDLKRENNNFTFSKEVVDYIEYLKPILVDFKDGEPKLTQDDVDYLMMVLRAKIEFYEGVISKEEYETLVNKTEF